MPKSLFDLNKLRIFKSTNPVIYLPLCRKTEKTDEWLSRKILNRHTDRQTDTDRPTDRETTILDRPTDNDPSFVRIQQELLLEEWIYSHFFYSKKELIYHLQVKSISPH